MKYSTPELQAYARRVEEQAKRQKIIDHVNRTVDFFVMHVEESVWAGGSVRIGWDGGWYIERFNDVHTQSGVAEVIRCAGKEDARQKAIDIRIAQEM